MGFTRYFCSILKPGRPCLIGTLKGLLLSFSCKSMEPYRTLLANEYEFYFCLELPATLNCHISIHVAFKISLLFFLLPFTETFSSSHHLPHHLPPISSWMNLSTFGILVTCCLVTSALWWLKTMNFEDYPVLGQVYSGSNIFLWLYPYQAEAKFHCNPFCEMLCSCKICHAYILMSINVSLKHDS